MKGRTGVLAALIWLMTSATLWAEDVAIDLAGIDLTANLELAPAKSLKRHGAVLLVHDTFSHNRGEFISSLQQMLRQRGVNSLAINLSYGLHRRLGPFDCKLEHDHRHEDALAEIDAWFRWLKDQGAKKIILVGRGRGANQAALFISKLTEISRREPALKGLFLISPMTGSNQQLAAGFQKAAANPTSPALAEAKKMIKEEEGDITMTVTNFLGCQKAQVTANTYANYYTPNPQHNTLNLLPSVLVPVKAVAGALDPESTALSELMSAAPNNKQLSISIFEGADQSFQSPARETLVEAIEAFVSIR